MLDFFFEMMSNSYNPIKWNNFPVVKVFSAKWAMG